MNLRAVFFGGMLWSAVGLPQITAQVVGEFLPPRLDGGMDIHHINNGERAAACFILPDGTTMQVGPDGTWDEGGLMQGQGFENVGEKTYIYYGSGDLRTWTGYKKPIPPRGSFGLATLPRDRFGDLSVFDTDEGPSEFVTTTLEAKAGADQRLFVNADGLGPEASLKIELLSHDEKPLPGYSGADAAIVTQSGFQIPAAWKGREILSGLPEKYRIRTTFEGSKKADIRFSAF